MNLTQHGKDKINCFILSLHKNASKLLADKVQLQLIYSKACYSFEQHSRQFAIVETEAFASRTSCYESLMLDAKCKRIKVHTNSTTEKTLRKPAKMSYNDRQKQSKKKWQRNSDKRVIIV